jgi:hypothetical protein
VMRLLRLGLAFQIMVETDTPCAARAQKCCAVG